MKHLIRIEGNGKVAMSVKHEGRDQQYAEAGDTIKLNWQPASGWGLQEAHYTDGDSNIVPIDLESKEFTMPDSDIVIAGTAKRFVVQDWTTDAPTQEGKVLGIDENGNLIPVEAGGDPTYAGNAGNVMQNDGNGGIVANAKVNVTAGGDVNADRDVNAGGDVIAGGDVFAKVNVIAVGDVFVGDKTHSNAVHLYSPSGYEFTVKVDDSGNLVVTQVV